MITASAKIIKELLRLYAPLSPDSQYSHGKDDFRIMLMTHSITSLDNDLKHITIIKIMSESGQTSLTAVLFFSDVKKTKAPGCPGF